MNIQISSWNSQGKFRQNSQYLGNCLSHDCPNVLLLQEEGVPGDTGFKRDEFFSIGNIEFKCVIALTDPLAVQYRCTTAIAVQINLLPHIRKVCAAQYATARPMCYIDLANGVRIATIHAIADDRQSVQEVLECIKWLDKQRKEEEYSWILMGDFNSEPIRYGITKAGYGSIQRIQYAGSSTRGQQYCNLYAPACPTQGGSGWMTERIRCLDYVFTVDNPPFGIGFLQNMRIWRPGYTEASDHNFISVRIMM